MKPRILPLLATLIASAMSLPALPVYFGNYAPAIQLADFDPATGALSAARDAASVAGASFLAKSTDGRFLYAVGEGKPGGLFAFSIGADGLLTQLNTMPSEGGGPCDIALSPDGKLVATSNYGGGSVIAYRVRADGALGEKVAFFQHAHASQAHPNRQKKPHAHGVTWSPDGKLLLVPDLGGDRVYSYSHDAATGTLEVNAAQPFIEMPAGSGPRHAIFSGDGRHFYVINELSNTVAACAYDDARGVIELIETFPTLPSDFKGQSTTAELALSADGKTLYGSNRGHDSLALFTRDPITGRLVPRGHVNTPVQPRHFALSPDGKWLLAAGQSGNRVEVFAVDPSTGDLTPTTHALDMEKPVCVRF
ncbi:MAG: lactonase family protein [Burkholderiales bacterium]|nr:lactonase family protein [Opitutaceae bacterium]